MVRQIMAVQTRLEPIWNKWKYRLAWVVALVLLLLVTYWAWLPDLAPEWTGFGPYETVEGNHREKKLWDWFELLIAPWPWALVLLS